MTPEEIHAVRLAVGATQVELAQLLGVHPMTVSKWERGALAPGQWQLSMLGAAAAAVERDPRIGELVVELILGAGVPRALYQLLRAAYARKGRRPR